MYSHLHQFEMDFGSSEPGPGFISGLGLNGFDLKGGAWELRCFRLYRGVNA